jgi:hypothetical protein
MPNGRLLQWNGFNPQKCDVCGERIRALFINGRLIKDGTWRIMCMPCNGRHGSGYGENRGILYAKGIDGNFYKVPTEQG